MVQGFWLAGGSEKLSGKWVTAPSGVFGSRQGHLGSSDTYRLSLGLSGLAIGRSTLVDGDLAAGRLVAPLDRRPPSGAAFYLVMPERSRKLKDVRAFRDWLFHELEMTDK